MFHPATPLERSDSCDIAAVLERLAQVSSRPRYAFMLLNLIAQVAGPDGSAGPWIKRDNELVSLRDWLCDALTPMAQRSTRNVALAERVHRDLVRGGVLPRDAEDAQRAVAEEMRARIRTAGKSNLSRAVSELVNAGFLRRHYQGYRVDHPNRGGQRHAVYTLIGDARLLVSAAGGTSSTVQGEFVFPAKVNNELLSATGG
ncbi:MULTISPECIES: hypothetical protein [Sphingobium]|uniref:Uncharacterized protein n=1 Tax=Sphingobium fuliginis ATCC 27551 TaxID=1208342 RepID=A0A5B8CNC3_SPHSA|nr:MULTISPECIES: hypothetical protein [Sphingobium]ARR57453.1 hypothetical protein HY78_28395 [Rhizorhabdus wittichii DC-6]QDC40183.1 hypothetical protein FIL70_23760 [Sphingobium fuliginis ATCC 27551]UXC93739.1 hypothetical protein EGM87_23835 [Sphingobium sp. RSMS]